MMSETSHDWSTPRFSGISAGILRWADVTFHLQGGIHFEIIVRLRD